MTEIIQAKEKIKKKLLARKYIKNLDYLSGVGVSWTNDDKLCVVVWVSPDTPPEERDRVPKSISGFEILVEEQEAQILGTDTASN